MKAPLVHRVQLLRCVFVIAAAGCAGATAADSGTGPVGRSGKLVAGIAHVAPVYKAGEKFRTPEGMETALVEDLAARLKTEPAFMALAPQGHAEALKSGKADVVLTILGDTDLPTPTATIIPTGYASSAMAIMRADTDIKSWDQLKGRTVCVSEDSRFAGSITARHGAVEKRYRAPADSLLALRTGACDAAVHDSGLLKELIKLPEWKKFSATLPALADKRLVFVIPASDAKTAQVVQRVAMQWRREGRLAQLTTKKVRTIAFEVYLDQDVPDCH
jgi:polar amino acid transport system substrate-binding protein